MPRAVGFIPLGAFPEFAGQKGRRIGLFRQEPGASALSFLTFSPAQTCGGNRAGGGVARRLRLAIIDRYTV